MWPSLALLYFVATTAVALAAGPVEDLPYGVKVAIARRSPVTRPDGTVDGRAFLNSLNSTLKKYHAKNTLPTYSGLLRGILKDKRGNVALTDQVTDGSDELYYGSGQVGAKTPQKFTFDFDTGSSDLFIPGPKCGSGCVGSTTYDQGGTDEGNTTSVTYGSGSVKGENYFDKVCVGGLCASKQNVISLTSASGFSSSASNSLLGMAFQQIAQSGQPPFFQSLINEGKVKIQEFSFYLGRAASGTAAKSQLTLGGRDKSRYTGSFTKVPVTNQGYWQVAIDSMKVGGTSAGSTTKGQAAIDTGTTIIIAPTIAATPTFALIPGAVPVPLIEGAGTTIWSYPCTEKPAVSLTFAGNDFVINALDFSLGSLTSEFAELIGSSSLMDAINNANSTGTLCLAALIAEDISPTENLYVVGDTFLKNWYASFNYVNAGGEPSVSFAKSI